MHQITSQPLAGTIAAIPAKAHAHRALIAAALATSPSTILLNRSSKDIDATMDSLRALGATITYEKGIVHITPGQNPQKGQILPHESGTTLRLLLPVATSITSQVSVDAKGRLPDRPLEPLLGQMKEHGIHFSQDKPPFTMTGHLQSGHFHMVGNVSSQFFSGLLLAAPQLDGDTTITCVGPLQSKDYVNLTMQTMAHFGVHTHCSLNGDGHETFTIHGNHPFHGRENYAIEGDWSNGAIWLVAAAMTGKPLTITGLNPRSIQADRRIMHIIEDAGCHLHWDDEDNVTVTGKAYRPLRIDLEQMPDLLPVLASLAASIEGGSTFINGARLRLKESDRLESVANLITDLGGKVSTCGDNLHIIGTGRLQGGTVDCVNDHRLVMAGTLAALIAEAPVKLIDSEAISKSYPQFFEDWNALGGLATKL